MKIKNINWIEKKNREFVFRFVERNIVICYSLKFSATRQKRILKEAFIMIYVNFYPGRLIAAKPRYYLLSR